MDNLVEKLCLRFKNSSTPRQWRDIAFCLSMIPFTSTNSFKKLVEGLPHYADKLHEPDVYKCIGDVVLTIKKQKGEKVEKSILEEFEARVLELRDKCVKEEDTVGKASGKRRGKKSGAVVGDKYKEKIDEEMDEADEMIMENDMEEEEDMVDKAVDTVAEKAEEEDDDEMVDQVIETNELDDEDSSDEEIPIVVIPVVKALKGSRKKVAVVASSDEKII